MIQKTIEATDDLIGNKISNKITKIHHRIIQLQTKKKYVEKDIYF